DDVRVRQPRRRARLAQEEVAQLALRGEMGRQHLDRDVPVEAHIAREEDRTHAAASELALDGVLRSQRQPELAELRADERRDVRGAIRNGWRRHTPEIYRRRSTARAGAPSCPPTFIGSTIRS